MLWLKKGGERIEEERGERKEERGERGESERVAVKQWHEVSSEREDCS